MLFTARCWLECCLFKLESNQYSACRLLLKAPSLNLKHVVPVKSLSSQQRFEARQHIQHRKQNTPALVLPHMHVLMAAPAGERAVVAPQNNVTQRDSVKLVRNAA